MSQGDARSYLEAQVAATERLLERLPADRFIERMGLESRLAELREELSGVRGVDGASAALFFDGAPVEASRGIDARFASAALSAFQDLVAKAGAATREPLKASGPIAGRDDFRLYVTGVTRGSFGFELEALADPGPVREAIDGVDRLLGILKSNDERFEEAAVEVDHRVLRSALSFFEVLRAADATIRFMSATAELTFTADEIALAIRRSELTRRSEIVLSLRGRLLGILLDSKAFEFFDEDGKRTVRGKAIDVADEVARRWYMQRCVAVVRAITVETPGRPARVTYHLLSLEPVPE